MSRMHPGEPVPGEQFGEELLGEILRVRVRVARASQVGKDRPPIDLAKPLQGVTGSRLVVALAGLDDAPMGGFKPVQQAGVWAWLTAGTARNFGALIGQDPLDPIRPGRSLAMTNYRTVFTGFPGPPPTDQLRRTAAPGVGRKAR